MLSEFYLNTKIHLWALVYVIKLFESMIIKYFIRFLKLEYVHILLWSKVIVKVYVQISESHNNFLATTEYFIRDMLYFVIYIYSSSKIIVMYHAVAITLFLRSELFPIIISLTNYHLLKIKSCKWVGQKGGINIYKIL